MPPPQPSPSAPAPGSTAPAAAPLRPDVAKGALEATPADELEDDETHEPEPDPEHENETDDGDEDEDEDEEEEQRIEAGDPSDDDEAGPHDGGEDDVALPAKPGGRAKSKRPGKQAALGITSFPQARVMRILKLDDGIEHVSREAAFLITVASELFLKTVAERAYTVTRLEKRRYIAYGDVQNIVAKDPHWSYLQDVVPDPIPYGDALARREQLARHKANAAADFFAVPPPPGLERSPYAEGYEHGFPPRPLAYPEDGAPLASGESDVEMKEA